MAKGGNLGAGIVIEVGIYTCPAIRRESTEIAQDKSCPGANAIQSMNIEDPLTCLLPDSELDSDSNGLKAVTVAD